MLAIKSCRFILICMVNQEKSELLFPRFQRVGADGLHQYIAEERSWMGGADFEKLIHPAVDTHGILHVSDDKGKWNGIYHRTTQEVSLGLLIDNQPDSAPFNEDRMSLYRYRSITHSYLWDEQAVDGSAHEIVLERLMLGGFKKGFKTGFREVMAILAQAKHLGAGDNTQRLVMIGENGEMEEPDFADVSVDPARSFCIGALAKLSVARS